MSRRWATSSTCARAERSTPRRLLLHPAGHYRSRSHSNAHLDDAKSSLGACIRLRAPKKGSRSTGAIGARDAFQAARTRTSTRTKPRRAVRPRRQGHAGEKALAPHCARSAACRTPATQRRAILKGAGRKSHRGDDPRPEEARKRGTSRGDSIRKARSRRGGPRGRPRGISGGRA